jgi:hypothetical protein
MVFTFLATPTIKLTDETERANRWRTINNKPFGPIIMMGLVRNTDQEIKLYLLHSFLEAVLRLSPSPLQTVQIMYAEPKLFS